jgi:hypothetical protein
MVDPAARGLARAGLVVAVLGILLTWYLWRRSGASLAVTAFVRAETSSIHVEVASTGRLAATVRAIEIRDHFAVRTPQQQRPVVQNSRWTLPVTSEASLPVELAPTAFIEADVQVADVLALTFGARDVEVCAWAQRGDGKWFGSKPLRLR